MYNTAFTNNSKKEKCIPNEVLNLILNHVVIFFFYFHLLVYSNHLMKNIYVRQQSFTNSSKIDKYIPNDVLNLILRHLVIFFLYFLHLMNNYILYCNTHVHHIYIYCMYTILCTKLGGGGEGHERYCL